MAMISENIAHLRDDISLLCHKLGRNPQEITLVVVTKFASIDQINEACAYGITDIAENKVQEAENKFAHLKGAHPSPVRHMIGHLQTNKVKDALRVFDIIQSVDSLKLAQSIDQEAKKLNRPAGVLVQINTSGEAQKFGFSNEEAFDAVEKISVLNNLRILGLMTMAPLTQDEEIIRNSFRQLRQFRDRIKSELSGCKNVEMKYLSMGMTSDYRIAIEEGSNMVRIGRAIFKEA
ncbi:MAG: YggS family pyridoxal phosphate-dependent enzyme [Candidatus Omnitrophota bacterium]